MQTAACYAQRFAGLVALCLLVALTGGCAQTAEELAEGAAPPATEETLAELTTEQNQRRLNELMTLPGFSTMGERLSRGFARGIIWSLDNELEPAQVEALTSTIVEGLTPALIGAIDGQMSDSLEALSLRLTRAALGEALAPEVRRQIISFVRQLARAATQAVMQVVSEQLRQEIGPAVAEMITDDLGPALAQVMREEVGPAVTQMMRDEEFRQALGETAHTLGRQSVLGANAGLRDLRDAAPDEAPTPLESVQQVISQGEDTLQTVLWMLGAAVLVLLLVVIALGVGLWRAMARGHELIEESKVREESLSDMAHAVSAAEEGKD